MDSDQFHMQQARLRRCDCITVVHAVRDADSETIECEGSAVAWIYRAGDTKACFRHAKMLQEAGDFVVPFVSLR